MTTTKKNNTILVPTDFSEVANNALEHAIMIAKLYGNEILLLHIVEESGFLGSLFGGKNSIKDGIYGQMLQEKLDNLAKEIETKNNIPTKGIIREGKIYKTIQAVSEEIDCDSIVMGTNGASGMEAIVGSNSSRVISHASVPVVVVKEKRIGTGYKNIVLPIDLTLESKQKVRWAIHVGKKFNSTIHILYEKESDDFLNRKVNANISQVEDVLIENGIAYKAIRLDDKNSDGKNFAEDTLMYAEKVDADLIMIMTQQERELGEYILGSYAQQIVNKQSSVPVMCISPRQTMKTENWTGF